MATAISNKVLRDKCRRFIEPDPSSKALFSLIEDALITAEKEIRNVDQPAPLAWLRETYNELFTRTYAEISAVTQASPGVITAESMDDDITDDHGFSSDDIVYIDGIDGMDELNRRIFRFVKINATTGSLKQLNGQAVIDTTNYDAYSSGGYMYHAGIKLPSATIEPTGGVADYEWVIGSIFGVSFDLNPADPISEEAVLGNPKYSYPSSRPARWRYQRYGYGDLASSPEHFVLFYPPAGQRYNISISIEKSYPDISTWTAAKYPPHPPEVHDAIWHRGLANLATNAEKQRRSSESGDRIGQAIEILYAQMWQRKAMEDEIMIQNFSRRLLGGGPSCGPRSGMKA